MQLPARFRRGIVLPLNIESEEILRTWFLTEPVLVQFLPIPTDELFYSLENTGFFKKLSMDLQIIIGDYEECIIEPISFQFLFKMILIYKDNYSNNNNKLHKVFIFMEYITKEAIRINKPLFFVL